MIDTNQIAQVAQDVAVAKVQLSPFLPALAIAAGWIGREIRNLNAWIFAVMQFALTHGGFCRLLVKLVWNNDQKDAGK